VFPRELQTQGPEDKLMSCTSIFPGTQV
jgi:hypothetical protein